MYIPYKCSLDKCDTFPVKLKVKSANVSLKYAIYFARNETLSLSPSFSPMMMSCDWRRVVNKSGADLWQLERPSSYPAVAVAARRAAKLQAHGKVEQLPEISQSQSQWRGAVRASCLTGFSTRESWCGLGTKPHWTGLKRAQRSRWISSRITIILENN